MAKRLVWFTAGAGAGAAGATYLRRKLRQATQKAPPVRPGSNASARVKAAASEARAALAEGTAAVRRYRAEVARRALDDPPGR
ncbi:MAG: hypothetical protein KTV68_11500 [Acidimicrobiia bacterium]|nr:hypothetical protein [Acidimicrobiia bacterium]MCY4432703.1 hypothetical protein [bacterium]